MIHLAKHIELLLLDNDCVIIPRVGGFVAHYTPAGIVKEEEIILPPYRTIGFNPQLKINDGVLAESYMNLYGINFNEANKRMNSEIDELLSVLHENGQYEFANIGELHYNIYGIYEFKPYDNMLTSPTLYGLGTLPLKELGAKVDILQPTAAMTVTAVVPEKQIRKEEAIYDEDEPRSAYVIKLNRTFVRSAVAVAAMLLLLFAFSTPIKNNNILADNQAKLVPDELLNQLKSKSILNNLIEMPSQTKAAKLSQSKNKVVKVAQPIVSKVAVAVKANEQKSVIQTNKRYHVIVASSIAKKRAEALAKELREKGYNDAKVLISGKMVRVSIAESDNNEEAQKMLNKLSDETEYNNMWVMKEKSSPDKN